MRRLSKDAVRGAVALLTAAVFASVLPVGAGTRSAAADGFSITGITASCDGAGLVYFTGTIPEGGFTLELMDKAPDNSGPFVPTSPPTIITIVFGDSPVAYALPLANWSPPHYRVDSNFQTKSASLSCEAVATDTPRPTATNTAQSTASATRTPTVTGTAPAGSTSTPTAVLTTSAPASTASASGASPAVSASAAAVNTALALVQPPNVARLPSALPNTGEAGAGWTRAVLPRALGVLAIGLLVMVSGCCYRSAAARRDR